MGEVTYLFIYLFYGLLAYVCQLEEDLGEMLKRCKSLNSCSRFLVFQLNYDIKKT